MSMNNLFSVKGKVALVTGGSRGIGEMIATGFVENGVKVYVSSRKKEVCDSIAAQLSERGTCISLPYDLSRMDGIKGLAAAVAEATAAAAIQFFQFGVRHGWDAGTLPFLYEDQAMPPGDAAAICRAADPVAAFCANRTGVIHQA